MSSSDPDEFRHRDSLRQLYANGFAPRAWTDRADYAFIAITLIERSIALLAKELSGDLLDVGCGRGPYDGYFGHVRNKRNCDYGATRGRVDFVSSAVHLPVKDAAFDSILCTEVLE